MTLRALPATHSPETAPAVRAPEGNDRRPQGAASPALEGVLAVLFIAALVHAGVALCQGWSHSILDGHAFRQTQTAISTYYLLHGGHWLAYETPVLGPTWTIPFEFPLYQWLVAATVELGGLGLEQAGRLVSLVCFGIAVALVHAGLGHWAMRWPARLAFLTVILVSPLYLFWSRTFMIESLALCLSLAYLLACSRFMLRPGWTSVTTVCLFGCLAGLTKITTFYGFALAAALLFLGRLFARGIQPVCALRPELPAACGLLLAGASIPLAVVAAWTRYTDALKAQVPLADFILSSSLVGWNFGTYDQRVSSRLWSEVTLGRIVPDTFGSIYAAPVVLGVCAVAALCARRYRAAALAGAALFLVSLLTFTNLHMVHAYYPYANAIFLLAACGFCLAALLESPRRGLQVVALSALVALVASGAIGYNKGFRRQARHEIEPPPIARVVREHVPENAVILVYGRDWSSTIPYYARRRAIMDRAFRSIDAPALQQSFALLGSRPLGGVVSCGLRQRDPEGLRRRLAGLQFGVVPVEIAEDCELYLPEPRSPGAGA